MPLIRTRKLKLDGNGEQRDNYGGQVLMFYSSLSTVAINITWLDAGGNEAGTVEGVLLGQLVHAGGDFAGYAVSGGDPDDSLQLLVGPAGSHVRMSAQEITIGHVIVDNEIEVKNDAANPIPVDTDEPALARGVTVVDVTNAGPVAVTDAGDQLIAAGATRKSVRFRNVGDNPVALLAAAANDFDNAAVLLQPGETWNEIEAPGAAWFGKCGAGLASEINVQSVAP